MTAPEPAAAGGAPPFLVARHITKTYGGVAALSDVSLEISPGEVHCLAGENGSGKSTLIKVISGVEQPDSGEIEVGGTTYRHLTPRQAKALGIEVIFQDFSLFPNLTVAENIAIAAQIGEGKRTVRPRDMVRVAREIVTRIGVHLDLDARVEDLTVADRQLTAICRALAHEARVIFMDEPTTALTWREVQSLFRVVDQLKDSGVALVFVSHKLEEVLRISERITVIRNGNVVASGDVRDYDSAAITRAMTGRDLAEAGPVARDFSGEAPLLEVRELTLPGAFEDVSFDVHAGEVVGVTGLLGSGRTEIAEALFGILPATSGTVRVNGTQVRLRSVQDAVRAGIGYVPADRLTQGVFLDQSIARNIMAGSVDRLSGRAGLLDTKRAEETVTAMSADLRIKMASADAPVRSLSGGNQQRVVLAKWLARNPHVLILNSPTVGVDVGSKHEILELLRGKSAEGMGVVVISDDVPELVAVCHRVLVVRSGRIVDEMVGDRLNEQAILKELVA